MEGHTDLRARSFIEKASLYKKWKYLIAAVYLLVRRLLRIIAIVYLPKRGAHPDAPSSIQLYSHSLQGLSAHFIWGSLEPSQAHLYFNRVHAFRTMWPLTSILWCYGSVKFRPYCHRWTILYQSILATGIRKDKKRLK